MNNCVTTELINFNKTRKPLLQSAWFWGLLFIFGIILGAIFYKQIGITIADMVLTISKETLPVIESNNSSILLLFFYIVKNSLVALICVLIGYKTKGIFPFVVIIVNSLLVGCFAMLFDVFENIRWFIFLLCLTPHGIIEISAICLACAIGMQPISLKERVIAFKKPFVLLIMAAILETYVSPLLVNKFM